MLRNPKGGRKLLVASIGVATMTYVGTNCGGTVSSIPNGTDEGATGDASQGPMNISGNLVAPVPVDARADGTVVAPMPVDARADGTVGDEGNFQMYTSGNLMAYPVDAPTSDSPNDAAPADSHQDSPADATATDSPADSATDTGPSTFDVVDDWPIANLIAPILDGGE